MSFRIAAVAILVILIGCERAKTGESCEKSTQCADAHACFAKVCVEHGTKHIVDITLVGLDHDDLACAVDDKVAGLSCGHAYDQTERDKTPAREDTTRLQPMTTKSGLTVLASGVWSQPAIQQKLNKSKPKTRFTASCEVVLRGSVEKARVRWKKSEGWHAATHVPVVVAESCTVGK